jgi:hypothetical protein
VRRPGLTERRPNETPTVVCGRTLLFVVYAAMPDVFAPYWCVQVEPLRHERRWLTRLFAYLIMKGRGLDGRSLASTACSKAVQSDRPRCSELRELIEAAVS